MQTKDFTIQIRQRGQTLPAFRGCRFVALGTFTGDVAGVDCFDSVKIGDARDPRRGCIATPKRLGGAFTVELLDESGNVARRVGVGTVGQVAAHAQGNPFLVA